MSGCNECGGAGYVVVCIDDLCRGAGECMHGDGEEVCRCVDDDEGPYMGDDDDDDAFECDDEENDAPTPPPAPRAGETPKGSP